MNRGIFKAYDIRGLYPSEINEEATVLIIKAFLNLTSARLNKPINELKVMIGQDNRESSTPLMKVATEVLLKNGVTIDNLGLISANDYYFSMGKYKYDGGVMATASHNPAEYGGFKLLILNPDVPNSFDLISGESLLVEVDKLKDVSSVENLQGSITDKDIFPDHLEHILSFIDLEKIKKFKVVVDTGGGVTAIMIKKLFNKLPCELIHLFSELDSSFSCRPPNPLTKGAWDKVSAKVLAEQADLGVMFDVDGDRVFLIDELGQFIKGDMTLLLLAKKMLKENPGAGVVYNLICSHSVKELVAKWGGKPIRSEVGYSNLSRHIKEDGGLLSGEVAGHFAFRDNYYSDNAFLALVLALQTISEDGRPLSQIIKDYSLYVRGDENNLKVENIAESLAKIRTHYHANLLDEFDGITVEFNDWWFNVRPSNTEPLLRITVEANNQEELEKHQAEILNIINN